MFPQTPFYATRSGLKRRRPQQIDVELAPKCGVLGWRIGNRRGAQKLLHLASRRKRNQQMARIPFYCGKCMRYPPRSQDRLAGMKCEALVAYSKMHRSRNHV